MSHPHPASPLDAALPDLRNGAGRRAGRGVVTRLTGPTQNEHTHAEEGCECEAFVCASLCGTPVYPDLS